ncbi:MAG: hypothetical protein OQJ99_10825 [Rhodospirillales bacterium]|nr:hypothetical protein [Rhodospirillales bacterium]MCW8861988.1 hypothetical protein [Rhodospirillales bacterium]MCW8952963.1 hypothetical protein [Rhodospirillales bacterium]MCW8969650.1 hypothetical protein [Rhodospirillales bacterium]MCW9002401.1 hypothetical protein [Rhodospirillales bacterium]
MATSTLAYDVLYVTDETLEEIRARLRATCRGAWDLRRVGFPVGKKARRVKVFFERESDISALCHPANA